VTKNELATKLKEAERILSLCWNAISSRYSFPISSEEEMSIVEETLRKYFNMSK